MATNYEMYFGSPERVAMTRVEKSYDSVYSCTNDDCLVVFGGKTVARCVNTYDYLRWLQAECDE